MAIMVNAQKGATESAKSVKSMNDGLVAFGKALTSGAKQRDLSKSLGDLFGSALAFPAAFVKDVQGGKIVDAAARDLRR